MESICYGVGGIFDDSRSVSSLTTVLVSNRSKVTPETCSMTEVPHNGDEKDIDTIDTDPSHDVTGSHHQSILSGLTASDDSVDLDADLQAEVQAAMEQAKKKQRKRNVEGKKQAEHEDQKKPTKKRRDDEDDKDGNEGGGAAAAAAPPVVSTK